MTTFFVQNLNVFFFCELVNVMEKVGDAQTFVYYIKFVFN